METQVLGLIDSLILAAESGDAGALEELSGIAMGGDPTARQAILRIDSTPEISQLFTQAIQGGASQ